MPQARILTWLYWLLAVLAAIVLLRVLWIVVLAFAPVIVVAGMGSLLAVLLDPLANRLQRGVRSRPLAALAVVVLLLAPFVALVGLLVATLQREALGLLRHLPQDLKYISALFTRWQTRLAHAGINVNVTAALERGGQAVLNHLANVVSGVASVTAETVLVLVVAFFLIWDGAQMSRSAYALLPRAWQATAREIGHILSSTVADFVRGQVLVGTVFGVIVGVSLALLGLPDPVLLGFLAGVFELLPTVGPFLGGVAPVALALAQGSPWTHVLWVVLVLIGAQQLESNVLVPRISGGAVGLHPLTVILTVFAGWNLAGLTGALLAVPAAGVARELLRRWWLPQLPPPDARRWPHPAAPARAPALPLPAAPPVVVRASPPPPPAPTRGPDTPGRRRRARGQSPG